MQRYDVEKELGDGTYGKVFKATNRTSGEVVAIKRLKKRFLSWNECISLRELESLRSLRSHDNIVAVKELIREEDSQLYFVFEYMPDGNLYQLMKKCAMMRMNGHPTELNHDRIRSIVKQVLQGLDHMHQYGLCHRDIKPENLLLKGDQVKIADFGLARHTRVNPNDPSLTEYISTRWYRAPEILLRDPAYGPPVDIFALGCVAAEMFTLKPLFPGSDEIDQIFHIVRCLGFPSPCNWPEGMALTKRLRLISLVPSVGNSAFGIENPSLIVQRTRMCLEYAVPTACPSSISLLQAMLRLDPMQRPTAQEFLNDPFYNLTPENSPGTYYQGNRTNVSTPIMHAQKNKPRNPGFCPGASPRTSAI